MLVSLACCAIIQHAGARVWTNDKGQTIEAEYVSSDGKTDMNYKEILKTTKEWEQSRLDYRFFDVPDMGHTNTPAEKLEEALKWIGM